MKPSGPRIEWLKSRLCILTALLPLDSLLLLELLCHCPSLLSLSIPNRVTNLLTNGLFCWQSGSEWQLDLSTSNGKKLFFYSGKLFSLSRIGGMPCFRLSIQSWAYRSFNRYLYSDLSFLLCFLVSSVLLCPQPVFELQPSPFSRASSFHSSKARGAKTGAKS